MLNKEVAKRLFDSEERRKIEVVAVMMAMLESGHTARGLVSLERAADALAKRAI